jgi:hypothetical protein
MNKIYRAIRRREYAQFRGMRPWQRHSQVVAGAGLVYVAYGVNMLFIEPSDARVRGLELGLSWMSLHAWGVIWVFVGMLGLVSTRWPPASETWGYSALAGLAALWSLFYALGMVFLGTPVNGIAGALVWGLVSYLWWGISGLRNPEEIVKNLPQE